MPGRHRERWLVICLAGAVGMLMIAGPPASAQARPAGAELAGARSAASPRGPVSARPASGTPELAPTGSTEQVRQLVQCGSRMYAAGSFTSIRRNQARYQRHNVFSFSATAPYRISSWNPDVNGPVNSIAFNGRDCAHAYIGGRFTSVHGTAARNIAEIDTSTGAVVRRFRHNASGPVETLLGVTRRILAGGFFKSINGSSADRYMAALNPKTGKDDGFIRLGISGHYSWPMCCGEPAPSGNRTRVYNQALSHSGRYDLVMGDFTRVGGRRRQQIFMLHLAGRRATVTGWTSPAWDGSQGEATPQDPDHGFAYECTYDETFYIRAASWSPDDSTIYIGTTGDSPYGWPGGATPRTGLCDAAAAIPATVNPRRRPDGKPGYVLPEWVNYTGCDSLYSTAADASTAYFGGHERWSENPDDCDAAGPSAIPAPGMEGLSPATGALTFNPTRSRGLGADDMLLTRAGLWIASDNFEGSQACGGSDGHAGICLLPYR